MTMNQQTTDQGWQQLHEIIDGFVDHVFRMEKENALINVNRGEVKIEQSGTNPILATLKKSKNNRAVN
jgi:hypothetical protein